MKKLLMFLFVGGALTFLSCEDKSQYSQTEVIDRDTTGVEYEVERQVREKTVDVDTTTETVTKDVEKDQQKQEQQRQ